jgi:hypothetical protein
MPVVALFMAINIIIGCYAAIRLGYGPPNWQTALNQVVRLTTFQHYLNEGRYWLERKAPWTEKFFNRFHIPKPIIFVDVSVLEEEAEILEGNEENETDDNADEAQEEVPNEIVDGSSGEPIENLPAAQESPTPASGQPAP